MTPRWRWILAIGTSALAVVGGLLLLYQGGSEFAPVAWVLIIIGALTAIVNVVMRNRFL